MDEPEAPFGIVRIGKRWEHGTLGEHVEDNLFRILYEGPSGNMKFVIRDVKDNTVWREGVDIIPGDDEVMSEKTPKAKAPKAKAPKPAKDPNELIDYSTGRAKRGGNKFPADAKTHVCTGKCGERKPAKSFPTISGTGLRVSECRACRDERRHPSAA